MRSDNMKSVTEADRQEAEAGGTRITVTITARTAPAMERRMRESRLTRADLVNRGILLYDLVEGYIQAGGEVILRDPETGKEKVVHVL